MYSGLVMTGIFAIIPPAITAVFAPEGRMCSRTAAFAFSEQARLGVPFNFSLLKPVSG